MDVAMMSTRATLGHGRYLDTHRRGGYPGASRRCQQRVRPVQALVVRCHGGEVGDEALLVVGTEEKQWTYSLRVDRPP